MQDKELRADNELKLGKFREFDTIADLLADLHYNPVYICPICGLVYYPECASDLHRFAQGN